MPRWQLPGRQNQAQGLHRPCKWSLEPTDHVSGFFSTSLTHGAMMYMTYSYSYITYKIPLINQITYIYMYTPVATLMCRRAALRQGTSALISAGALRQLRMPVTGLYSKKV